MKPIVFLYKAVHKILSRIGSFWHKIRARMIFIGNGVEHSSFRTTGVPYLVVARGGRMMVGSNFVMNNGIKGNPIGIYDKCTFFVDKGAELIIGDNVGISQTALISHCSLRVGNNVKMGGVLLSILLIFMLLIWKSVERMRIWHIGKVLLLK